MEIPRHWRLKAQRYRLEGSTCLICGHSIFPPRPVCSHCTGQLAQIGGKGLAVVLISTDPSDIKSRNQNTFTERMIR